MAKLVIISLDASNNTVKKFTNMCEFYRVPLYRFGTNEELGHYIGKGFRVSLAVKQGGLAKSIIEKLESEQQGHGGDGHDENKGS